MQIAVLTGVYGKTTPDFVRSYPVNLTPVAHDTGINKGYLRTTPGITRTTTLSGPDRGGIVWNGVHYRVVGTQLVSVSASGAISQIASIPGSTPVSFTYSFDRLAIASGGLLYYLQNGSLSPVTDPDIGTVLDVVWSDGYFITTDGDAIVVTELNDPGSVDPLKYGSAEADPDPIRGLLALRGEVYALGGSTIEVFTNSGSTGFPFRRQRGAQIPKGVVGTHAFAKFVETFAFCGAGEGEAPAVYLAGAGQGIKISPIELDEALQGLSEAQLAMVQVESINGGGNVQLMVHLPTETWVYHWSVSQQLDLPTWTKLAGGTLADKPYPARHFTLFANKWWCGSATALGYVDDTTAAQFGATVGYRFDTPLVYNAGEGAIIYNLELVPLAGRGGKPHVMLSWTDDGVTYSEERPASLGRIGDRAVRPAWRRLGSFRNWRGFRFRGLSDVPVAFVRLEAQLEGLSHGAG